MKIATIIPTLNEAAFIGQAVRQAWAAHADEVIVVDGGSQDATLEIAAQHACRILERPPGRASQQNAGAEATNAEILFFQHADTWLEPHGLIQVRQALSDPHVLGGAFRQKIDAEGLLYRWLEHGNAWRARVQQLPYGDQGIFLRRDSFIQLGRFPEVPIMEDLLLMKQLRRRSRPVLLRGPLHVSARRWRRHGVVRQTLHNLLLRTVHRCGASPARLAKFYPQHDA